MSPDPLLVGGVWEEDYILPTSWERGREGRSKYGTFLHIFYFFLSKVVMRPHSKHLQIWLNKHTTLCTKQV